MPTLNSMTETAITTARLDWENDQPVSRQFGDVYFSRSSGLEETRYVFLKQNQLPERFAELTPGQTFTIAETGFGTGLNFLCACQLFLEATPHNRFLHFISTEKYPMHREDLKRVLSVFTELAPLSLKLTEHYRVDEKGIDLHFQGGRVRLQVLVGDVMDTLPELETMVDCWFLDGFAPAKNPQMWQPELFRLMAEKSHRGTTYATFTAARIVRDGLRSAGFSINKLPGFGKKRDMIAGSLMEQDEKQP